MQKISRVIGITDCQLTAIVLLRQQIRIKAPVSLRIGSVMLPDNHRIVGRRSGPNSGRLFIKSLKSSVGAKNRPVRRIPNVMPVSVFRNAVIQSGRSGLGKTPTLRPLQSPTCLLSESKSKTNFLTLSSPDWLSNIYDKLYHT